MRKNTWHILKSPHQIYILRIHKLCEPNVILTIWPVLRVRALQADSTVTLHLTIDPCDTNGINENGMANLTLYPNPTTGMVNVQFTMNNVQSGAGEIQMLDVYGRLLQTVETCHGASLQTTQIDLSHYATGIYFVRMVNGGKVMAVRKVVKE